MFSKNNVKTIKKIGVASKISHAPVVGNHWFLNTEGFFCPSFTISDLQKVHLNYFLYFSKWTGFILNKFKYSITVVHVHICTPRDT